MNLRQLKYFVKIVETGNMTRAAADLLVAQPALGKQVRQLEESVGVPLLLRHSRGVEATPAGQLLYARAQAILQLVEDTRRDVAALDPHAAATMIRLGMTPSLMLALGPEIAVQTREQLPQVFLSVAEEMSHVLVELLARDALDLALAYEAPDVPQLTRIPLQQEDLVLVTLPGPLAGQPITLSEALEERLVLAERRDVVRELVERAVHENGLEMTLAYEVRSIAAFKSLILRGEATSIMPYASVIQEEQQGLLQVRPIVEPTLRRTLYLVAPQRRAALRHEDQLVAIIRKALAAFAAQLGAQVHPLHVPH
ncbi:LysR family transcriptional regulator [Variovorax sp. HJSM1_2]|uniref:LysR family transcriptional regulator n=1 Tax=Variovorax sp. HJSM1_2 TaxID=3366263 RepID=UPI003BBA0118